MPELDPYATLGVPRTATREEIARAYRQLAKRHHPDVTATPSPTMARINEAWSILSSPARRARWDTAHAIVLPPTWVATPRTPARTSPRTSTRPPPAAAGPPSVRDSPWFAAAAVGGVTVALLVAMFVINAVAASIPRPNEPFGGARSFTTDGLTLSYPEGWSIYPGEDDRPARGEEGHAVVAQLASGAIAPENRCVSFILPCFGQRPSLGTGQIVVLITEWRGGTPPLEVLDAGPRVGGAPAAFRSERFRPIATFLWQISPPDYPNRWFEVVAHAGGGNEAQDAAEVLLSELLGTIEFTE